MVVHVVSLVVSISIKRNLSTDYQRVEKLDIGSKKVQILSNLRLKLILNDRTKLFKDENVMCVLEDPISLSADLIRQSQVDQPVYFKNEQQV